MTDIARAVQFLKQGRLVAFATETVYGLGADATNPGAIARIYLTKGRPTTNPLIIHVADLEMARRYVADWPEAARQLAERFWPGPLTLVLPKSDGIPLSATAGLATMGLRAPNHPVALELLRAFGGALAAPSANRSTRVSPTTAHHVREEFPDSAAAGGETFNEPAMILDGGACAVGIESTVLDLTVWPPVILRPGSITAADLEAVIGIAISCGAGVSPAESNTAGGTPAPQISTAGGTPASQISTAGGTPAPQISTAGGTPAPQISTAGGTPAPQISTAGGTPAPQFKSPGQQETHYAPRTATYRFETSQRGLVKLEKHGLVVLSPLHGFKQLGSIIAMPNHAGDYAQRLYAVLRELDAMGLEGIFIEMPPDEPAWSAIRDRITRASRPFEGF